MIKIRLAKGGKKNDPFYRIVVIEAKRKNTGKPLEVVGHWHPRKNEKKIDKDKIQNWVSKGAKISSAVKELIK